MTTPWRSILRLLPILMLMTLTITGCASVFQDFDERMQRSKYSADYEHLDRAITLYDEGDFQTALDRFSTLASASASRDVQRKARFGELCSQLMLARTANEYNRAIGMWHDFAATATAHDNAWDPVLLEPLIVSKAPPAQDPNGTPEQNKPTVNAGPAPDSARMPPKAAIAPPPTAPPAPELDKSVVATLKKKAERAESLQRQLDDVMAENQSLKEKIKALEAIDQKIQKKKTAIAEPGE